MSSSPTENLEATLSKPDVHRGWIDAYVTEDNARFYDAAFDVIRGMVPDPPSFTFLDVGCGSGTHSIRLAERGFKVIAIDFSEHILATARENIQASGVADRIMLKRANILALDLPDGAVDGVLCWGVLMHILEIERALSEICRVVKRGGLVVISEGNMQSAQTTFVRLSKNLRGKTAGGVVTPAGLETWAETPAGILLTRQANLRWLKERLNQHGFVIAKHIAGQFTEAYVRFHSRTATRLIHGFNQFWFSFVRSPRFAFGTLIFARKEN
jgi:ubiquinone/menaquinone biosynthesis C-methylase UbiE